MLRAKIRIGTGDIKDSTEWGLVYLDSDKRVGAPQKPFETTAYPEEEGKHILPKTVDDAFDYKVTLYVRADTLENVNAKIKAFNAALHSEPSSTGLKTYEKVEFYNLTKRHKIVGYPQEIPEATQFWRDPRGQVGDVAVVEWIIQVNKPSECNFNYTEE